MKIQKEKIEFEESCSFKLFSPSLKHYFYWHYHSEIELVYVEANNGIRHVGKHISDFTGSDLILLGSNVPHLNFDYGIETSYNQIVIQLKDDFVNHIIQNTPEFGKIKSLLDRAYLGLSFNGQTKQKVAERLKNLNNEKDMEKTNSLLKIMDVLQILATSNEVQELNTEDTRLKWFLHDKIRMGTIYNYIHENYHENPNVNDIAEKVHLSTAAFCRYFKKQAGITFTEFVNRYRISQSKTLLLKKDTIAEVCYKVGFESISYFSTLFKRIVGETPSDFKKKYYIKNIP
ncbi:AraC family transcriptional regulator [Elizabethkingia ursingii]|uniref:AraC family transcriptional regulator n=1 Tax=Elizabethkingia ursingii TaxID=1756150 RepID=UPI000751177C|nr:AraC family transcriptional regulator [Elizabethkingia ursingii]KUY29813.1 AraC family transcriptional regulator [Elizabethkingia ursingii]